MGRRFWWFCMVLAGGLPTASGPLLPIGCGARTDLLLGDLTEPCAEDVDCDDGIACSREACTSDGFCAREFEHALCSDGLYCNGDERCAPLQGCEPGLAPCDDSVACTHDSCDEEARSCASEPDTSLCPLSHRCSPTAGCVARALAHDASTLYEIELPSGEAFPLARQPSGNDWTDIALGADGSITLASSLAFWHFDEATGRTEYLFAAASGLNALDRSPDGEFFAGSGNELYRLTPDGQKFVMSYPPGCNSSGDLAFVEGVLFGTATCPPSTDDALVRFDLAAHSALIVGRTGENCVYGLAAFGGTLYGFTCGRRLLLIDTDTGASERLRTGSIAYYGAAAR